MFADVSFLSQAGPILSFSAFLVTWPVSAWLRGWPDTTWKGMVWGAGDLFMHVYDPPGGAGLISTTMAARSGLGILWRRLGRAEETEEDVDGERTSDRGRSWTRGNVACVALNRWQEKKSRPCCCCVSISIRNVHVFSVSPQQINATSCSHSQYVRVCVSKRVKWDVFPLVGSEGTAFRCALCCRLPFLFTGCEITTSQSW